MSVDDRDCFEEAVTTETRAYWANESPAAEQVTETIDSHAEWPAFLAMGTDPGVRLADREEDLEVTQPIPRITMAELVNGPAPTIQKRVRAQGTISPVDNVPALALGTMSIPALADPVLDDIPDLQAAAEQVDMPLTVPGTSRKVRPRRTRPRARTIAARRLTNLELRQVEDVPVEQADRPRTRAECAQEMRPCPWVSCKHHLYLDVNPRTGSIKLNFPDLEPWELQHTCALDVADDGGHTLEEVGDITNLTRERIRQLEFRGLLELRGRSRALR